jgi:transposase
MLTDEMTNPRALRGLEIAATKFIAESGDANWLVPSQNTERRYRVVRGAEGNFNCTCPDFELTGQRCKHGFAVAFMLRRETKPDGTVIETRAARITYSQPWTAHNKAQTSEKEQFCVLLKDLVSDVPSPEQKRGRPALPLADMIFSAAFKVYSTVSARRFMTDLRTATEIGMIDRTPHYNSIFNVLDKESLTPILLELITRAALPLKALETKFAVDSTGFGTQSFYRHFSAKYGRDKEKRAFLKCHAMIGTRTNVITAVSVTDSSVGDAPVLTALLSTTAGHFNVAEVSADKAYASTANFAAIEAVGAKPFVPFKSNAVGTSTSQTWNRLFHFFHLHREEFLSHYHARSNAESTFSAMKRKFGETLRSKTPTAQRNEMLLKVLCYNIVCVIHEIHASGAVAAFPALAPACTKTLPPAQQGFGWE